MIHTVHIYKSYGVLGHEKQPFYSVGHPASEIHDVITVTVAAPVWETQSGELGITLDGDEYLFSSVLTNSGEHPVLRWFDGRNTRWMALDVVDEVQK